MILNGNRIAFRKRTGIRSIYFKLRRDLGLIDRAKDYEYEECLNNFLKCLNFIKMNRIQGDILQFGVGKGRSLIILNKLAKRLLHKGHYRRCRVFGFDSFEGLPEPNGRDTEHPGWQKGTYRFSKEKVISRLGKNGVDSKRVRLVEGWYEDTLTPGLRMDLRIKTACLIDIDCDFYESAIKALRWCEPLITQGTILNFDDWFCYAGRQDCGEQRAFSEFLAQYPEITAAPFSTYSWHGKSFIMSRKEK